VQTLGNDPAVIAGAAALVGAEKNFNPFVQSIPAICSDATLPATEALRGIVPLVDPAVTGSDVENANAATSLKTPFAAAGLSVADVMAANGFSNLTTQAADGKAGAAPAAGKGNAAAATTSAVVAPAATESAVNCAGAATITTTVTPAAAPAATTAAAVAGGAAQQSAVAGVSFGQCVPTIKFEAVSYLLVGRLLLKFANSCSGSQRSQGHRVHLPGH
jgi:hypothetical protein